MLAAKLRRRNTRFRLFQNRYNLLFAVTALTHLKSSLSGPHRPNLSENSHCRWTKSKDAAQANALIEHESNLVQGSVLKTPFPPGIRRRQQQPESKTLADSQGTSSVLCGDDLKSELGSLPTKAILCAANSFLFSFVEDTLVVGLSCAQQVKDNTSKLVGRGCNCLRPAEFARDAAEGRRGL
jgi:hypothetical protein